MPGRLLPTMITWLRFLGPGAWFPGPVLHETNMANDVSLRKIILGGTPDHRTLRGPPSTAVPRGA